MTLREELSRLQLERAEDKRRAELLDKRIAELEARIALAPVTVQAGFTEIAYHGRHYSADVTFCVGAEELKQLSPLLQGTYGRRLKLTVEAE